MPRFLHISDIHLGFDRYDNPERSWDFFRAFEDVIERYAIAERVDFVLIAGDLFEHRQILPSTLNQARLCLQMLRDEGIPVLAIEGNHDYRLYGTTTSWLRYLADWEFLKLLEPDDETGALLPWNPEQCRGGYIDLPCGVRVIGSQWYGASAPTAILALAKAIPQLPPPPPYTVMMFHHGLEGQVARYVGALRYQDILPLKQAGIDYLALGHIHRQYAIENWVFNPGSLEANSISENQQQNPRGAYLVELTPTGIQADLKQDYQQRQIIRLQLPAEELETASAVEAAAIYKIQKHRHLADAIVELRITGQVRFARLDLDVRALKQRLLEISGAMVFLLKYDVTTTNFDTAIPQPEETRNRQEIEKLVFSDLLAGFSDYRHHTEILATGVMGLKDKILEQHGVAELYEFSQQLYTRISSPTSNSK
jgi:DNA repair protein SbcD/Mre11